MVDPILVNRQLSSVSDLDISTFGGLASKSVAQRPASDEIRGQTGCAGFAIGAFVGVAALGTLASLMLTRGKEKELADYYDQAIAHGKILVAVETDDAARQQQAEAIFKNHGDQPVASPNNSSPN